MGYRKNALKLGSVATPTRHLNRLSRFHVCTINAKLAGIYQQPFLLFLVSFHDNFTVAAEKQSGL